MTGFWAFCLLVLVVCCTGSKANKISFPDALYPTNLSRVQFRSKCPLHSKKIDFCVPRYEDCFGRLRPINDCKMDFCSCIKVTEWDSYNENLEECTNYSSNACVSVHSKGNTYQKEINKARTKLTENEIMKKLEPIAKEFAKMQKDCGIESKMKLEMNRMMEQLNSTNPLLNLTLPYFAIYNVESSINKTKICREAIDVFQESLEIADAKTVESLHIPYQFWYIGTEFGSIAKVATRILADETCDTASLDFNHHSVVHVNCYDQQAPRSECDETYIESNQRILSTMDSKKLNCKMFVDLVEMFMPLRADQFYKEAAEYHMDPSRTILRGKFNRGFAGFDNGSMTRRDTKSTFLELEASEKSPLRLQYYFDRVSSECGNSRRSAGIVASCGFKYEYCIHYIKSECQVQLSICLSDVDEMNETCQDAIKRITGVLYPNEIGLMQLISSTSTIETYEKVNSCGALCIGIVGVISIFVVILLISSVIFGVSRYCMSNTKQRKGKSSSTDTEVSNTLVYHSPFIEEAEQFPLVPEGSENIISNNHNVDQSVENSDSDEFDVIHTEHPNNELPQAQSDKFDEIQ